MLTALWSKVVALVRSGRWPTVRKHHLEKEPFCQSCFRENDLEVHHILPVHAGGDELDPDNLITFCRDCHFVVGHACDWKSWRPEVKDLAKALQKSKVKSGS